MGTSFAVVISIVMEANMSDDQTRQNPDINSFINEDDGDESGTDQGKGDTATESIPVPPGTHPPQPIEEPPGSGGPPSGDVDDSPKQIV